MMHGEVNYNRKNGGRPDLAQKALETSFAMVPGSETNSEKSVSIPAGKEEMTLSEIWPNLDAETQGRVSRAIASSDMKPENPDMGMETPKENMGETGVEGA